MISGACLQPNFTRRRFARPTGRAASARIDHQIKRRVFICWCGKTFVVPAPYPLVVGCFSRPRPSERPLEWCLLAINLFSPVREPAALLQKSCTKHTIAPAAAAPLPPAQYESLAAGAPILVAQTCSSSGLAFSAAKAHAWGYPAREGREPAELEVISGNYPQH